MKQYGLRANHRIDKNLFPSRTTPFSSTLPFFHKKRINQGKGQGSTKISELLIRIKSGGTSTLYCSHMTNSWTQLKQSKLRVSNVWELKQQIDAIFQQNNQVIEQLILETNLLAERQKSQASWNGCFAIVSVEMQQLQKMIEDIRFRINGLSKYNLNFFRTVFQKPDLKVSSIANERSRKETLNSIIKDGSLLLSFKKNLEEDDGHITLKYSEQSATHKNQQKEMINPFSHHHFQSFAKCDPINKKLSFKDDLFEIDIDQQYSSLQKDAIKGFAQAQQLNTAIKANQQQVKEAISIYEELINKFIQAIAQEKVQAEHQANKIVKQVHNQCISLHSSLKQISQYQQQSSFKLESMFLQLGQQIFSKLQTQKQSRLGDQKGMIKMMLKVVQYLQ